MNLSEREIKIAERLFLAYSYRQFVSKKNKMIVIFNYHFYPILFAINNGDDTFTFSKTISDKKSFDKFDDLLTFNNDFQKYLRSMFMQYPFNIKNYKAAICNFILEDNLIEQDQEILIDKSSKNSYSLEEAKQILINEYDVSLNQFKQILNSQSQESHLFELDNMNFVSSQQIDENKIKNIFMKIKQMLSNSVLSSLLYGTVQIKDSFQDNTVGDYNKQSDIIRTGGDEQQFINTFIHELGHRWDNKISSNEQRKAFKQLFNNCNGKHLSLKKGDIITFWGNNTQYVYYAKGLSSLILQGVDDKKLHYYQQNAIRSIKTINGQEANKYRFPSYYSRKKFTQFIAECIAYAYSDNMNDKKLQEKVKEIVG